MQNILDDFLLLLDRLGDNVNPLWGKMSAQHMVEHLILAVRMSNGKLKLECFNPPDKLPVLKKFLTSNRPLPQNFINPVIGEGLMPLEFESLEMAKNVLKIEIQNYFNFFINNPNAVLTNVTFGDLNKSEWEIFHRKHFAHHFKQFGLID